MGACGTSGDERVPSTTFEEIGDAVFPADSIANDRSGGGFAVGDLTGDGLPDILVANGYSNANPFYAGTGPLLPSLLLNQGDFQFEDVPLPATVEPGWFTTAAAADLTRDGHLDLYIPGTDPIDDLTAVFGDASPPPSHYFLYNRGDGTFEDASDAAGVDAYGSTNGVCVADFDNDGWLDLYLANHADLEGGFQFEADTGYWKGQKNRLLRNLGERQFEDVSDQAGPPTALARPSTGCLAFDYDRDLLVDLWVPYDGGGLAVYRNLGNMQFEDVSEEVIGSDLASAQADWMGFAVGDYNGDGLEDVFVTNFGISAYTEIYRAFRPGLYHHGSNYFLNALLENQGDGSFVNVAPSVPVVSDEEPPDSIEMPEDATGLAAFEFGWDAHFADFDDDGDLDLYWIGNLGQDRNTIVIGTRKNGANPGRLMQNLGDGRFAEVSEAAGVQNIDESGLIRHGWGSAVADLDGSGSLDIAVANQWINVDDFDAGLVFYQNRGTKNHWLEVELVGRESNPHGIGARLKLRAGGRDQHRAVISKASHSAVGPVPQHFGLGKSKRVEHLEIWWPSGRRQMVAGEDLPVDGRAQIIEPMD